MQNVHSFFISYISGKGYNSIDEMQTIIIWSFQQAALVPRKVYCQVFFQEKKLSSAEESYWTDFPRVEGHGHWSNQVHFDVAPPSWAFLALKNHQGPTSN